MRATSGGPAPALQLDYKAQDIWSIVGKFGRQSLWMGTVEGQVCQDRQGRAPLHLLLQAEQAAIKLLLPMPYSGMVNSRLSKLAGLPLCRHHGMCEVFLLFLSVANLHPAHRWRDGRLRGDFMSSCCPHDIMLPSQ